MRPGAANEVWSLDFLFDRVASGRSLFVGKAMLNWAHRDGVTLRPIEPCKPNQSAYI